MSRVKELYKIIKDSQDELAEIRKNCPHTVVFEGNYSYSDASRMQTGYICKDCGDFLGKMKTAKEWIEDPRYRMVEYHYIKEYLLQQEYTDIKLSWDQYAELTNVDNITPEMVKKWLKAKSRDEKIDDIIK